MTIASAGCDRAPESIAYKSIVVELRREAASATPTLAQVQPYAEALVFHQYRVIEVLEGKLDETEIQVGHWAVAERQARPVDTEIGAEVRLEILPIRRVAGAASLYRRDDLPDLDLPEYVEVPPAEEVTTESLRMDYGGPVSSQMSLFWALRNQLRLVAIGNSRTGVGVLTGRFFPEANTITPVCLNLSPPGSNMELQSLLVNEYLMPLPKLEWVVWGISPRYFNEDRREEDRFEDFLGSHGRHYDVIHRSDLWPFQNAAPPITVDQAEKLFSSSSDVWGATPREDGLGPVLEGAAREEFLQQFSIVRFEWDEEMWDAFADSVTALDRRGVNVLLFTPPLHPACREGEAADPDNSGREHEAMVVAALGKLDRELSHVWFQDIHDGGRHGLLESDFSDAGHLDRSGAEKLTARLVGFVEKPDGAARENR